jgi:nucleoid-associated protein YgaU
MLTAPLKIGLAAACLVVVAILIAVDVARTRAKDEPAPAPAASTALVQALPPAFQPPMPVAEPVICPPVAAEVKPAGVDPVSPEEPPKVYTVLQGDSLYGISVKVFGTPRHYERIYEANKDRIKDPNTLQVGINLRMPDVAAKPIR